jgi:hypothetical protein
MAQRIEAYAGAPTLTWMIAQRVCNTHEDSDAFITFVGRKGSGKSTSSVAFAEGLANDIARARNKGEDPSIFFNIDHIKTITSLGAVDILTSGILKQENSILLLDDTGTQWGARNFASQVNKTLNSVLQIMRVYRGVLIANFIAQNHVDLLARQMQDYRAEMQWKDTTTGQAFFKFYFIEQGTDRKGNSKEYKKFLTWHLKRITTWVIEKPSPEINKAYQDMRRANTDKFIEDARNQLGEKLDPNFVKVDKRVRDYTQEQEYLDNKETIKTMLGNRESVSEICHETGIGRYKMDRYIGLIRKEGKHEQQ